VIRSNSFSRCRRYAPRIRAFCVLPWRVVLVFMLTFGGCRSAVGSTPIDEDQMWISATRVVLSAGDTTRIGIVTQTADGIVHFSPGIGPEGSHAGPGGAWSSSDSSVVTVQSGGLVTGRAPGRSILKVTLGRRDDSALVFIQETAGSPAHFSDVGVGVAHGCGLTYARLVYCWGISWFGETGLSTIRKFTATVSPALVPGLTDVVSLSVGGRHTCALISSGRAFCWGEDLFAASSGSAIPSPVPVPPGTNRRFVALSAGGAITCGILVDRTLLCWAFGSGSYAVSTPEPLVSITWDTVTRADYPPREGSTVSAPTTRDSLVMVTPTVVPT
jgi:hypothetical protein